MQCFKFYPRETSLRVILSSSIFQKGTVCPVRLFIFSILTTDCPQ